MRFLLYTILIISSLPLAAQKHASFDTLAIARLYESSYKELQNMIARPSSRDFKKAVFLTENAYSRGQMNYSNYEDQISRLVDLCNRVIERGGLIYNERDKQEVNKYASVFVVMKQLQIIEKDSITGKAKSVTPFKYDFDDFWGDSDWSKMFVTKLLSTRSGNCHSLPFLYKILCEELDAKAYLAMAPNHIYIKHWCRKLGWYNTELTSGQFPIDAWIMASGYVHLSAIQNGMYMDTLSRQQSIAVCLVDLAKGYERTFTNAADPAFLMKCVDLALQYYPHYSNGLILKAETLKQEFEKYMKDGRAEYPSDALSIPAAKSIFLEMEKLYLRIHTLGYRMMPKEMYQNWLDELQTEKEKYTNRAVTKEFGTK